MQSRLGAAIPPWQNVARQRWVMFLWVIWLGLATGFGADAAFDLQGFIDAKVAAGATHIVIPRGRYRVVPHHGRHLVLSGLSEVSIVAEGVELICTQTSQALRIENCRNVSLSGLTIDYDPLPFTQARVSALAPDRSWLEFEILAGYPCDFLEERIEIYDPVLGFLRRDTAAWEKEIEPIGERRFRVRKRAGYRFNAARDTEKVGDLLVTNHRSGANETGHCVELQKSSGVKLEDMTVYASPIFGFYESRCDGTIYRRCRIDRRPPKSDLVERAVPRMRSLNADAFHSADAQRGPRIENCVAKFQGDDCVNIHGTYSLVTGSQGRVLRIAVLDRLSIEPGDALEFLPCRGARPGDAVAVSLSEDAPITEAEKTLIAGLRIDAQIRTRLLEGRAQFYSLTLDREVDLPPASAVCSGKHVGNGFVVQGCEFGFNRSRGILIKASRGEVLNNRVTAGWMAAVLVAPEFWWMEAASASHVRIEGNLIRACRRPAIEVKATGGNTEPLPAGAHRDIQILNNRVIDSVWPNIAVASTDGLLLRGNQLGAEDAPLLALEPWDWRGSPPGPVVISECTHVRTQR